MASQLTTLLDRRRASATVLKVQFKDGGTCHRCGYPYAIDPAHMLGTTAKIAFALMCETCWRFTTAAERLELLESVWTHSWSKDAVAGKIPYADYRAGLLAACGP